MGESKKATKCKLCILSFIVSIVVCFAGVGVISRIVNKVLTGHGLDYYTTFVGFQFNYIGALVMIIIMFLVLLIAPLIHYLDPIIKEEKDFKKKYEIQDN